MRHHRAPLAAAAFLLGLLVASSWRAHADGGFGGGGPSCYGGRVELQHMRLVTVEEDGQAPLTPTVPSPLAVFHPPDGGFLPAADAGDAAP
jgi:hypothetical protein